jgi:hypothetical protein
MPKYALEIGGKTYDIESEKALSDTDLASYASKIAAPVAQPRGTVPEEPTLAQRAAPAAAAMLGSYGTLGQGISKGVGDVMFGAQTLLGKGAQAIGMTETGRRLQEDAAQRMAQEEAKLAPMRAAYPGQAAVGEFGGQMIGTLPVGGVLATPVRAAGAPGLATALQTSGFQGPNMLSRVAGGAAVGGVSGGILGGGEGAQTGALIGGALPAAGAAYNALSKLYAGVPQTPAMQQSIQQAREIGMKVPPSMARAGGMAQSMEGVAGKSSVAQIASAKNQEQVNRIAAETVGLAPDTPLNLETLDKVRAVAGKAYDDVAQVGKFKIEGQKLPSTVAIETPLDPYTMTRAKQVDSAELVRAWKQANADATGYYRAYGRDANPETLEKAKTAANDAKQIDSFLTKQLENAGLSDLSTALKNARVQIAKTYSVENALDVASGNINPQKLAQQLQAQKPLSGELKKAAEFAGTFPKAAQLSTKAGGTPPFSPLDVLGASIGAGASAGTGTVLPVLLGAARPAFRYGVLSDLMQNRLIQSPQQATELRNMLLQGAYRGGPIIGADNSR